MLLPGAREKSMCYVFSICFRVSCGYFWGLAGRNVELIFFPGTLMVSFDDNHPSGFSQMRALVNSTGGLHQSVGTKNCRY
jgi:hypothetical protein